MQNFASVKVNVLFWGLFSLLAILINKQNPLCSVSQSEERIWEKAAYKQNWWTWLMLIHRHLKQSHAGPHCGSCQWRAASNDLPGRSCLNHKRSILLPGDILLAENAGIDFLPFVSLCCLLPGAVPDSIKRKKRVGVSLRRLRALQQASRRASGSKSPSFQMPFWKQYVPVWLK